MAEKASGEEADVVGGADIKSKETAMNKYAIRLIAAAVVFVLWFGVWALGQRGRYDYDSTYQSNNGVATIKGFGDGGLTNYDLCVGDTTTPDYGMIQFGNAVIGRTSYTTAMNLDGTVIIRNIGTPTSKIQFAFLESGGQAIRFALATSGVGNATYNPRSMLLAGPAVLDEDVVTVGYWQTNNSIFDKLPCDTAGGGADLGIQNNIQLHGNLFADNIKESTDGAGITLGHVLKLPVLADIPASPANGMIWMQADGLHIYYNGAEKLIAGGAP